VTRPDGSSEGFTYTADSGGALLMGFVKLGQTAPWLMTDARGNVTTYTYAPEHGGVLTETQPAVGGVTPQKRYTYVQRTAWVANGAGGYGAAGPPVWLLASVSACKAGNPASSGTGCALGASDEVVTAYDYGPDRIARATYDAANRVTVTTSADGTTAPPTR
jgi:hypothetical protein